MNCQVKGAANQSPFKVENRQHEHKKKNEAHFMHFGIALFKGKLRTQTQQETLYTWKLRARG